MSMNLHVRFDDQEFDLLQTPTHISYMCTVTENGETWEATGKEALRALEAYKIWVHGRCSSFKNGEEADWYREENKSHIDALEEQVKKAKKIEVYII